MSNQPDPIPPAELTEMLARCAAVREKPWYSWTDGNKADFAVHARTDLPRVIDAYKSLEKELDTRLALDIEKTRADKAEAENEQLQKRLHDEGLQKCSICGKWEVPWPAAWGIVACSAKCLEKAWEKADA